MMARGNPSHVEKNDLNLADSQSLRAMLAQMELMSSRIKGLLLARTDEQSVSSPKDVPIAAEPVPEATNSQATEVDVEHTTIDKVSDVPADDKKNLPSPAATEDVTNSTQADEKPTDADRSLTESVEDVVDDPVLPPSIKTESEMMDRLPNIEIDPPSDDKTAVEEQPMEVD
jgi:hypothetical protein